MNTATLTKTEYTCNHCARAFKREPSLATHVCESKRRYLERDEVGVTIALQAYLRFYEITQGTAKNKTFKDFSASPYYRAFVKFGRYCQEIRAVNVPQFVNWVVKKNKKIDHWCHESVYYEYLMEYLRTESVGDALARSIESSIDWQEKTGNAAHDYLRYGNANAICYAISTGRVSAWAVYNCDSGHELLARLNSEQLTMIWPMVEPDAWSQRLRDLPEDRDYAREILKQAGW